MTFAQFGAGKRKREPVEVREPSRRDRTLERVLAVRKQRMERLERERTAAREAWRARRTTLRAVRQQWRGAVQAA